MAAATAGGGQADAGVAGGRLNDDGAFLQQALRLGVVDHGAGHAVLDRTGGIEVFELGENLCLQVEFLFNVGKLQKRRLADELICGCIDMRHDDTSKIFRIEKI